MFFGQCLKSSHRICIECRYLNFQNLLTFQLFQFRNVCAKRILLRRENLVRHILILLFFIMNYFRLFYSNQESIEQAAFLMFHWKIIVELNEILATDTLQGYLVIGLFINIFLKFPFSIFQMSLIYSHTLEELLFSIL